MNAEKQARLEAVGFRIVSVAEFLNLSPEEEAIIGAKLKRALLTTGATLSEIGGMVAAPKSSN